jgi:acetyl-CoA carboxylase biotin carboxyl carrier protein
VGLIVVEVKAEMPSTVCSLTVAEGQLVEAGDVIIILESMKMEIPVHAPVAGTIAILCGEVGSQVEEGAVIAVIE